MNQNNNVDFSDLDLNDPMVQKCMAYLKTQMNNTQINNMYLNQMNNPMNNPMPMNQMIQCLLI